MGNWQATTSRGSRNRQRSPGLQSGLVRFCDQCADLGLLAVILIAPWFFGGRHPLGRLVFVSLVAITTVSWFARQLLSGEGKWVRTWANLLGLACLALVSVQLLPLPPALIQWLAPRQSELFPLWAATSGAAFGFEQWQTLSLVPFDTKMALATLTAYVALFVVVTQQLERLSDIQKLYKRLAASAVMFSLFGLLQYLFSNGKFFWFYEYPYSSTLRVAKGCFTCSNHFAHFVLLGGSALLAYTILYRNGAEQGSRGRKRSSKANSSAIVTMLLSAGLLAIVLAVLWSLSRGGAVSLAAVGTISLLLYYRANLVSDSFLACGAVLAIAAVGILSLHGYDEVATQLDDFASGSIEVLDGEAGRRTIWEANLGAIAEGGWFGAGAGSHRELYPAYLAGDVPVDYTHAESGPLQIGTENGYLGLLLLLTLAVTVGHWCWTALRFSPSTDQYVLAVAATAALGANAIHSLYDFVWFIPACMTLTILFGASLLRLAQLSEVPDRVSLPRASWGRPQWTGALVVCSLAMVASVAVLWGPGVAALHWDRYQLVAESNSVESQSKLSSEDDSLEGDREGTSQVEAVIFHLRKVLAHDPNSMRAHLRLAQAYLRCFDLRQQASSNAMTIGQIREAAIASKFATSADLKGWLQRAFGENHLLLYRAYHHAQQALHLSPLAAKAYLNLNTLCFLRGQDNRVTDALVDQALRCKPFDGSLQYDVGREYWIQGRIDKALVHWKVVFQCPGVYQLHVAQFLTTLIGAEDFLAEFQPSWNTLRYVWSLYHAQQRHQDSLAVIRHFAAKLDEEKSHATSAEASRLWLSLSVMQRKSLDHQGAVVSLRRAYQLSPTDYEIRRNLGKALLRTQSYQESQQHLRWCLARRPDDQQLQSDLTEATKTRLPSVSNRMQIETSTQTFSR